MNPVGEHEFEAAPGLPEPLPAGERILWQGAPDAGQLARRAFHGSKLAVYFAILIGWRFANAIADGESLRAALGAAAGLLPLAAIVLAVVAGLAVLTARTTAYTVTDRRVVMRIGIVLSVTFNLPYARIESADLRRLGGGFGDLPLKLGGSDRIAWLHLWPHARPWRLKQPEPMLRCVADAEQVAAMLAGAWSAARGITARPEAAPADRRRPTGGLATAR